MATHHAYPHDTRALATNNFGHFTSFQVRGKCVRGLDIHFDRLRKAQSEVFGTSIDEIRVRDAIHAALDAEGLVDASVRVTCYEENFDFARPLDARGQDILVTVSPARISPNTPVRLKSVPFIRQNPEIKHCGMFSQFMARREAQLQGYDDAIFVDPAMNVSEGPTWSFVCFDGDTLFWPITRALDSVTAQLISTSEVMDGKKQEFGTLSLPELGAYLSAFAINSSGIRPIASIDSYPFDEGLEALELLQLAVESHPLQPI